MKTSTVLAVVLVAAGLIPFLSKKEASIPEVPEIGPPSAELRVAVEPIILKFSDRHRKQAAELSAFYLDVSEVIRRDGKNERILKTYAQLRTFCERAVTIRFAGAFSEVPGLAAAIHGNGGALSKLLGLSPGAMDHEKVADAFHAIAWACQEARK